MDPRERDQGKTGLFCIREERKESDSGGNKKPRRALYVLLGIIRCAINLNPVAASSTGWRGTFIIPDCAIAPVFSRYGISVCVEITFLE